jgi:hypothetical protein
VRSSQQKALLGYIQWLRGASKKNAKKDGQDNKTASKNSRLLTLDSSLEQRTTAVGNRSIFSTQHDANRGRINFL